MNAKKSRPAMLNIGASKEAVKEARTAIVDILKQPNVDNATKVEALRALSALCAVSNVSVTGCQFGVGHD